MTSIILLMLCCLAQVQRVNFELTSGALLQSIIGESNHDQAGFISDVDIITVYLEHMVSQHNPTGRPATSNQLFIDIQKQQK